MRDGWTVSVGCGLTLGRVDGAIVTVGDHVGIPLGVKLGASSSAEFSTGWPPPGKGLDGDSPEGTPGLPTEGALGLSADGTLGDGGTPVGVDGETAGGSATLSNCTGGPGSGAMTTPTTVAPLTTATTTPMTKPLTSAVVPAVVAATAPALTPALVDTTAALVAFTAMECKTAG